MKKFLALMLSLALVFALAACGQKDTGDSNTGDSSNTDASADWPKANTRYIITASAGGGLDICARMLAPYWEKATDNKTVVTVENVTGGANWIGWTEMSNATPLPISTHLRSSRISTRLCRTPTRLTASICCATV